MRCLNWLWPIRLFFWWLRLIITCCIICVMYSERLYRVFEEISVLKSKVYPVSLPCLIFFSMPHTMILNSMILIQISLRINLWIISSTTIFSLEVFLTAPIQTFPTGALPLEMILGIAILLRTKWLFSIRIWNRLILNRCCFVGELMMSPCPTFVLIKIPIRSWIFRVRLELRNLGDLGIIGNIVLQLFILIWNKDWTIIARRMMIMIACSTVS